MNLFMRELKAHRKSLIIWSVIMGVFMYLSMAKYTALAADAQASQELMKALPASMQAIFGMTGLDLTTMTGYYGICFIFIAVMLAIHAGMLGAEIVAKEEVDKTAEFLYVKPIGRAKALTAKLLAGLVLMAVLFMVTYAVSYGSIALVNSGSVPVKELVIFTTALGIIQLTFYSLGVLAATALGRPKRATALTAGVVLVAYIIYVLQGLSSDFSWLKNFSPFAYFNAKDILDTLQVNYGYALICGAITLVATTYGYIAYLRRDFRV
jgi:ABC-2 type transport system permease protein